MMRQFYQNISELPSLIPILPLSGILLLPRGQLPLNIFETRYLTMVEDALAHGRLVGIIQPRHEANNQHDEETLTPLHKVGCLGRITSFDETPDGRILITLIGVVRFNITSESDTILPYRKIYVDYENYAQDLIADIGALDVDREKLLNVLRLYLERHGMSADWETIDKASNEILVNSLSIISPYGIREKQALLEAQSLAERNEILIALTEMALAQNNDGEGDNDNALQ